ncbi:MAG TPA: hypothetical protein VEQ60_02515 [Longimicrobium sp.]|nr:hypothetical protein [Longimicrobium sp.]
MKIKRCLLAVAVTVTAAACSTDPTAPDAALRAPESAATLQENETTTTPTPVLPVVDDGGLVGSGVGR